MKSKLESNPAAGVRVAGLVLFTLLTACSKKPDSYEDCVLEALEGSGKSEAAVRLIQEVCREKFPERRISDTGISVDRSPRSPASEALPSAGERVENQLLGIALARIPAGFQVARNEGAALILQRTDTEEPATLKVLVGPVESSGINLRAQVWVEKGRVESMPAGDYKGQNELAGSALGTIYTSRGRFLGDDGVEVEEYRVLAVHPTENRLLTLDYEYPPTERTGERLQELMAVIEQIEAIDPGRPSPSR